MAKDYKREVLINVKKTKSLLEKVITMIDEKAYCIDTMQQLLAAIGMLKSANQKLLEGHLNSCFKNAMLSKNKKLQQKMINEILQVSKLSNK